VTKGVPVLGGVTKVCLSSAAWTTEPGSPAAMELERLHEAGEPVPWFDELGSRVAARPAGFKPARPASRGY
jgi:hypothetical protein